MTEYALTQYGFRYGPVSVERLAEHKGYVVLGIETQRQIVQVTITPSGFIRLGTHHRKKSEVPINGAGRDQVSKRRRFP